MESVGRELYNSGRSVRNVRPQGLQGLSTESFPGQVGARLRRPAQPLHDCRRPLRLGRQRPDRRDGGLCGHPVASQVVADPLVAIAAVRQHSRPGAGEPLVVDIPDAFERVEGLEAFDLVDSRASEAFLDVTTRAVAMVERPGGDLDRVVLRH